MYAIVRRHPFFEGIDYWTKEFESENINYLEAYIRAVKERPFSKVWSLMWGTTNGAKYEGAKKALEGKLTEQEIRG